ncbi:hypothetical protein P7C73_g2891, partial [Tremellales sp. Uapishka_1]
MQPNTRLDVTISILPRHESRPRREFGHPQQQDKDLPSMLGVQQTEAQMQWHEALFQRAGGSLSDAAESSLMFSTWKQESSIASTGPTNSALWGQQKGRSRSSCGRLGEAIQGSPSTRPAYHPDTDILTTLPLPGDAHNPLALLAEASATSLFEEDPPLTDDRAGRSQKGRDHDGRSRGHYYAPLERSLKDEAPHIMSRINVQEAEQLFEIYFKYLHLWSECSTNSSDSGENGPKRSPEVVILMVIHSFGLQRAMECLPLDLPAAFAEYQTAAIRLINSFEADLEATGLIRGCPDFLFTVLTYATVSLLKATQSQFSHLEPNITHLFAIATSASSVLARSATASDHLPASLSVFISNLIRPRVETEARTMDVQAFDGNLDTSLWPIVEQTANGDLGIEDWMAGQDFGIPAAALGLDIGTFPFSQDENLMFSQDSFW